MASGVIKAEVEITDEAKEFLNELKEYKKSEEASEDEIDALIALKRKELVALCDAKRELAQEEKKRAREEQDAKEFDGYARKLKAFHSSLCNAGFDSDSAFEIVCLCVENANKEKHKEGTF